MLTDFPIYLDDTKLFWPVKWDESYEVMESKNTTEAGTDQIIVAGRKQRQASRAAEASCSRILPCQHRL